jgi:hypothetical protein
MSERKVTEEFKVGNANFRTVEMNGKKVLEVSKDKLNWHPCFSQIYEQAVKVYISKAKTDTK